MFFISALRAQGDKKTASLIGAERSLGEHPTPFADEGEAEAVAATLRAQHGTQNDPHGFDADRWEFTVIPATPACPVR